MISKTLSIPISIISKTIYLIICCKTLSIYLYLKNSIFVSIFPKNSIYNSLSNNYLSINLSIYLYTYLSFYIFIYLDYKSSDFLYKCHKIWTFMVLTMPFNINYIGWRNICLTSNLMYTLLKTALKEPEKIRMEISI